ncbi:hypothetical protein P154DRAFT_212206 [Amniculicola lignicola CBS 123094]|uniref:Uncharacterized protein n=1 Tax=Amniculicola lignicola CBS 123094 TaxID=1392246 RepID=A0A6A5WGN5_9PLEO|nr:hypothetical protein P154DRAFT_212206 [Amniculicola lignicola CBS 123094]
MHFHPIHPIQPTIQPSIQPSIIQPHSAIPNRQTDNGGGGSNTLPPHSHPSTHPSIHAARPKYKKTPKNAFQPQRPYPIPAQNGATDTRTQRGRNKPSGAPGGTQIARNQAQTTDNRATWRPGHRAQPEGSAGAATETLRDEATSNRALEIQVLAQNPRVPLGKGGGNMG